MTQKGLFQTQPSKVPASEPGKLLWGLSRGWVKCSDRWGQCPGSSAWGPEAAGQRAHSTSSPSPLSPACSLGTWYFRSLCQLASPNLHAGRLRAVIMSSSHYVISNGSVGCFTYILSVET